MSIKSDGTNFLTITHIRICLKMNQQSSRQRSSVPWKTTLEKDDKWRKAVDSIKNELKKDEDLNRVKEAHEKFGMDIEEGFVEAEIGVQAAVKQATWFWQDLFKVYIPRVFSKMRDVPVPRFVFFLFFFG